MDPVLLRASLVNPFSIFEGLIFHNKGNIVEKIMHPLMNVETSFFVNPGV